MIVSELEIHKVIDLLVRPTLRSTFPVVADSRDPIRTTANEQMGGIGSPDGRGGRLDNLRYLLSQGRYEVTPNMVADKMVGRAICDQVARLYDA